MIRKYLFGNSVERMPGIAFQGMAFFFKIFYFFRPPDNYLKSFGIKPGDTVVDYGCGPGAHIRIAASLVEDAGLVYAVDVHELAIESVKKIARKYSLNNVKAVLASAGRTDIPDHVADIIYAIDMFHMVKDTDTFLRELYRIAKPTGKLILEDGHQARKNAKEKILSANCWRMAGETRKYLICTPRVSENNPPSS